MSYQATGKIHRLMPTEYLKDTFRKRELILDYGNNPNYPQYVKFEFIQDSCELLDNFAEGQVVTVDFDLQGREWVSPQGETKYFSSIKGWRVTLFDPNAPAVQQAPNRGGYGNTPTQQPRPPQQPSYAATPQPAQSAATDSGFISESDEDDLPF